MSTSRTTPNDTVDQYVDQEEGHTGFMGFLGGLKRIPPQKRKSVVFAVVLTCLGLGMLISGLVLWRTEGTSALIGLWVCGILVLIPGIYFLRIVWFILGRRQANGYYEWSDIPDVM